MCDVAETLECCAPKGVGGSHSLSFTDLRSDVSLWVAALTTGPLIRQMLDLETQGELVMHD